MGQSFTHSADDLKSFFSLAGRGFYVPYYQRNYSWDTENAEKLVTDILSGVKRTISKPDNNIFLGTVILHEEKNVRIGTHTDTPNLPTKISNVVDGQQRITSLAMLACVLSSFVSLTSDKLKSLGSPVTEISKLANELDDQILELAELYSVEIKKNGASPKFKPIIIRAGDVTANPVSDQWTLAGLGKHFYKSNTSNFLSEFINGVPLNDIKTDARVRSVIDEFQYRIELEIKSADHALAEELLKANENADGSLSSFMAYPPDLSNIQALPDEQKAVYYGGILLLAACSFLKNSCHLVVIECLDEDLAFDMFQSLNATGTPLTAFEVFKPAIVNTFGANYSTTIKPEVDRIEKVFESESTANGKETLTDRIIVSSAMIYKGDAISGRFSDERDWLMKTLPRSDLQDATNFISCIADQGEYYISFIKPRKSPRDSNSFKLVLHLQSLGMNAPDADMAALCVFYLRDANHMLAHTVLSLFYAKLLKAQGNPTAVTTAAGEFLSACKAIAAFFTLWMGALQGRFPDAEYRLLFQKAASNISVASGVANQTAAFIKQALRTALAAQNIYDEASAANARTKWVTLAKETPWYARQKVCRFALFAASQDAVPDLMPGNEGLFTNGMASTVNFLCCQSWHASKYEVIEHVATRDKPSTLKFPRHADPLIYPGNYSVVDKLGNLTLLSVAINSSIYSEWPDKAFYYWSLTTPGITVAGPSGAALMASLGLATLPPSLVTLSASSDYLPHLAPLALRGINGGRWDAAFIAKRSQHLCERVFDKLDPWLR